MGRRILGRSEKIGQDGFQQSEAQHRLRWNRGAVEWPISREGELRYDYITRSNTRQALWPPKPKLFFKIRRIGIGRAS